MHDLRRQALESGKTVSSKAKSRQASAPTSKRASPAVSKSASRTQSRNVSDDEGDHSDTTEFSTHSIDEIVTSPVDPVASSGSWTQDLADATDQITDRKRSSVQGREESINRLVYVLMSHYCQKEISGRISELISALLKCVKASASDKEAILALKAISLILITDPSDHSYDPIANIVRGVVSDSSDSGVKVAAIHTLGFAAFYGGANSLGLEEVMSFCLEIVESDGTSVDAEDDAEVVTAALEEWGFLASQLEDMEDESEEVMEPLVDQLDSSHASVQVAAGENIALLYEKSFTELEEDEDPSSVFSDSDDELNGPEIPKMVRRYTVYGREHQLKEKLESICNVSTKSLSKKDRKSLHTNFADILSSIEHPTRGPRYSNAIDSESHKAYGSQMTVGIGGKNVLRIKTWEQLHRLKALRRVLQSGFLVHYSDNPVVFETLPLMIHSLGDGQSSGSSSGNRSKGGKKSRNVSGRMDFENGGETLD